MSPELVVVVACAVVFGVLPIIFRSNAVAVFLTLCAGATMSKLVAQDATQIVNSIANFNMPTFSIVQIVLISAAPVVLLLGLRKSVSAGGVLWQLVPAASAAVLAVMFITAALPYDTQKLVEDSSLFAAIKPFFGLAAAAGLLASVLHLWALKPKHHGKKGKKH